MPDDERGLGLYDGECLGCNLYTSVDDVGLCAECAARLDRDMIR